MLPEKIERLLSSKNEDDNKIAWELVASEKIPHADIIEYLERTKVPTSWQYKYWFNNNNMQWERADDLEDENYN